MKAYSPDLRLRILHAVDAGMPKAAVARRFAVALSTVKQYLTQRDAGPDQPKGVPGPACQFTDGSAPGLYGQDAPQIRVTIG